MASVLVDSVGLDQLEKKEKETLGAGLIAKACEVRCCVYLVGLTDRGLDHQHVISVDGGTRARGSDDRRRSTSRVFHASRSHHARSAAPIPLRLALEIGGIAAGGSSVHPAHRRRGRFRKELRAIDVGPQPSRDALPSRQEGCLDAERGLYGGNPVGARVVGVASDRNLAVRSWEPGRARDDRGMDRKGRCESFATWLSSAIGSSQRSDGRRG